MHVLVTGSTGLLGNNVVRQLLARGDRVRVLTRPQRDPRPLEGLDVEESHGDICRPDDLFHACRGVDAVIHSAADVRLGWSRIADQRRVNVEGTRNVAAAALQNQIRLVHVSTVDTMGIATANEPADEASPRAGKVPCGYVITKREAEEVVVQMVERGLDTVIVNPGYMLGPWDWKPSSGRMLLDVAQRFIPMVPQGGVSLCDARDVARGIVAALEQGAKGRQYILAGHNLTLAELWRQIAETTGGRAPSMRMGPLVRWIAGTVGDLQYRLTGREGDVNSATIASAHQFHYYRSQRATDELGYQPRAAKETIEDAWKWFQDYGYA